MYYSIQLYTECPNFEQIKLINELMGMFIKEVTLGF